MLQVCNGNFLFTDEVYKTTHRAPLYTNLSFPTDKVQLCIGTLTTTSYFLPITTLIAEVEEKQPAKDNNGEHNVFIATTGKDVMNDLAMVLAFFFDGFCTTSFKLAKEILSDDMMPDTTKKINEYVDGFFDKRKVVTPNQLEDFVNFFNKLVSLSRKDYIKAIKAIRRYATALLRISDDLDAAYALFVASIESLAQDFAGYETAWRDVEISKRSALDKILIKVEAKEAEEIRGEIIKHEHLALSRKFCSLVMASLTKEFYKSHEKYKVAGFNELNVAVKNAYMLRSKYVHVLSPLSDRITMPYNLNYCVEIEGKPYLSFNGLSKVNRQVLMNFIETSPVGGKEKLDPHEYTPGMVMMRLSEVYWMGNAEGLNSDSCVLYLDAILSRIESIIFGGKAEIPDMTAVVEKLGGLLAKESGKEKALVMYSSLILLKFFFGYNLDSRHEKAVVRHNELFEQKSVLVLLINTICGVDLNGAKLFFENFKEYVTSKFHKKTLRFSEFYESLMCANIINHLRKDGDLELVGEVAEYIIFNTPNSIVRKDMNDEADMADFDISSYLRRRN